MPAACRPAPDAAATSPGNEKRRKVEHSSPYPPPHAYPYAPPMTGSPKQGGAPHAPGSPYYPHPDPYSYMPPPGHHHYGPPPPHPQAGGFPPRPHLPPRYNHHPQYDPSYMAGPGPSQKPPSSPGESQNGAYPSPNTVTTMDSRSPEGSRNDASNFEERVSSNNGNPPPPPSYSPGAASSMPPYMPPPMGYHPSYPPPHYAHHHQYHSPHAPSGWACDYCNSKFNNWEECSAHEQTCAAKSYYDGRNSHKNAKGRKMKLTSFPADFYMDHNAEYAVNDDRKTYLLTTEKDKESLSDRQCFVRSHFVEVFVANKTDMAARHSRGAQKLNEDQIGLRCAYCVKLKPRDRAERAICYPSSISRIYQTVADMQRFHFESCVAIPPKVLAEYKSLKTTRPRGVGSPQGYWDKSAREIGLVDSSTGIKIGEEDGKKAMLKQRKGATGLLESSEAAPPVGEFPPKPMNEYALPPAKLPPAELPPAELPPVASPGNDQVEGDQEASQTTPGAPVATSVALPVVSSPGTPGTEEAPNTPVINDTEVKKEATREADANMLLMLKQTSSPTEDAEDAQGVKGADTAVTDTTPTIPV